ncbi:Ras converting CAAX endopeptidase 1 [Phyllostomus discolor]|uniref:Ras converting CAAX endopeptidase 1 n=1 Tax=Phyllostomus discolor TaxID=89673 RepID=A0A833ZZG2_9CHIR|nr:Ras converting CAAX endopeptidase 1 [Phyllostomus discolor]
MAALGGDGLRLLSVSRPERQPETAALGGPGPGLCCWVSVFSCLSLACSYVGSLYVWKSELPRDHPAVIKRRFTSVLVVSSLSPLCVLLWRELTGIQPGTSLLTLMGFRLEGFFPAALLPLLLTMILFLGPLMQLSMDCPCDLADGLKVVLGESSGLRGKSGPSLLGPLPHGHALASEPSDRAPDRGAGVPGLHAAHVGAVYGPGPCRVHLPALLRSCPFSPHF